jgi:hypothetical protein
LYKLLYRNIQTMLGRFPFINKRCYSTNNSKIGTARIKSYNNLGSLWLQNTNNVLWYVPDMQEKDIKPWNEKYMEIYHNRDYKLQKHDPLYGKQYSFLVDTHRHYNIAIDFYENTIQICWEKISFRPNKNLGPVVICSNQHNKDVLMLSYNKETNTYEGDCLFLDHIFNLDLLE